ncbi:MAG TPA: hypothetical protein VGJ45_26745 [Pseudonocardiaceae bacterium]|jgi:hypothetical protein
MRASLAGLAALLVLPGCGRAATAAPPPGPPKYVATSCPAPGPAPSNQPYATAIGPFGGAGGAIPDGFQPSWVLACPIEQRYLPGQGSWQVQVSERAELTTRQADALLAVLRTPSEPSSTDQVCAAVHGPMMLGPYYALVDRHGTALEPALPTDACGEVDPDVAKALHDLPYRELSIRPEAPVS